MINPIIRSVILRQRPNDLKLVNCIIDILILCEPQTVVMSCHLTNAM